MRRAPRACRFPKTLERRPSVCPDPTPTLSNIPGRCRPSFLLETPHVSSISRKVRLSPLTILDSGSPVLTRSLKDLQNVQYDPNPAPIVSGLFPLSADDNPRPPAPIDRRACETPGTILRIHFLGLGLGQIYDYCCNGSTSVLPGSSELPVLPVL